ncbi:MAG: hypothetical protein QG608_2209 [Actinomycetota bacterium]|nr:hypothetical protein [Actinomycetota bacterium]
MSVRPDLGIEQLTMALEEAAERISPSAVPLDAITSHGRRYRRRRGVLGGVVVGTGAALVVAAALHGFGAPSTPSPVARTGNSTASPSGEQDVPGKVRLLPVGEKIVPLEHIVMWLTENGERWQSHGDPAAREQTLADRRVDRKTRDSIWQGESTTNRLYWHGLYYGPGTQRAAGAVATTREGKQYEAHLVTTPDRPDWGVWYADTPLEMDDLPHSTNKSEVTTITIYDSQGGILLVSKGIETSPPRKS